MRSNLLSLLCVLNVVSVYGQDVLFTKRPTQVNDTAHQIVQGKLEADRTIRQQNQLVDTSKQTLERTQVRTLTILEIVDGSPARARLVYGDSSTRVQGEKEQRVEVTHPVAGNTYFVLRRGEELFFTDENGSQVTEEETKVLQLHMAAFGKPNPLADFLNGKQIQIGQSVEVPQEVARELLGLTGNDAKTDKLVLRLSAIKNIDGIVCGIFDTILRTSGKEAAMSLLMKGELVVESNTCRTRSIRLHGPVALSEMRGPTIGRFVVSTNGTLQVAVETTFLPAGVIATARDPLQR